MGPIWANALILFYFRSVAPESAFFAAIPQVWDGAKGGAVDVDFGAYGELELFVEQAPVVEEDDEKWREKIKVGEGVRP